MRTMQQTARAVVMLLAVAAGLTTVLSLASAADAVQSEQPTQVTLEVDGMSCRSCVKDIRKALLRVPGVSSADVRFKEGRAVVQYDPQKAGEQDLVRAVESASNAMYRYRARVLARGG